MTDASEADLIARIVEAPDDPAAYLVYADWLIGRGDPRGELIALQHAAATEPGKAKAVERHLKANRARLLGTLAEHESQIKLDWNLGFVRRARVIADDAKSAIELIGEVASSPACRFLQRLELVILGKQRSYLEVDAHLVERAEPRTLREIVLGRPGEHSLSDELLAAFPRVARRTAGWSDVAAHVKVLRGRMPDLDVRQLAPLTASYGDVLPVDEEAILRGLAAEVGRKQPLGLVAVLQATCDATTLDHYAASLVEHWHGRGQAPATAWTYDVAALLGGPRAARALAATLEEVSHARATHALECLARMRTPLAVLELFAASRLWSSRGELAEELLERRARAGEGCEVPSLLARAGADLGAPVEEPIAARFASLDRAVLEMLMVTGWTTTLAGAQELFVRAARAERARHLVWGTPRPVEPPSLAQRLKFWDRTPRPRVTPFVVTAAGAAGLDGAPLEVALDDVVGIAHPLELGPEDRERWWSWQRSHPPPFDQLDRESSVAGKRSLELRDRFPSFRGLRERGFRNGGQPNEAHQETLLVKRYPYRGQTYTVRVDFAGKRITCAPRDLPVVVQHELARDMIASLDP